MRNRLTLHRLVAIGCLAGLSFSTGCSSIGGGWFGSSASTGSSWSQSIASTGQGIGSQFKTMGTTVTSAVGKAKNAVVSTFSSSSDQIDPQLSLANMPSKANLGAEIFVTNGQIYEMKGNFTAALDNYTKALEQEPNNLPALQSVARLNLRHEKYPEAISAFQKVVAVSPTAENYSELSSAQLKANQLADAQGSIHKAISLEPSVHRYRNNYAGILVSMGRSDEAVKELQQVFPPAVANYNVAYLHFMNKNMAATQQHLQSALQHDPNFQPARDLMNTMVNNPTSQTAIAAYGVANQIYQATQGTQGAQLNTQVPMPTVPTNTSVTPTSGTLHSPGVVAAPSFQYSQLPELPQVYR